MDKKLLYFVRSLFLNFSFFLKSPKIGNFKKLVVESFQSDNDSQVWALDEMAGFRTGLNSKIKYLFIILFSAFVNSVSGQIAQRGTFTTATTNGTTLTINKPTGLALGDIMIAQIMQSGNNNATSIADATSSGWTRIAGSPIRGSNGNYSNVTLLYKFALSADVAAANFSFALQTDSDDGEGAIIAFSGVDNSNPFDVTPGTAYTNISNDQTLTANSITTTTADTVILMFGAVHNDVNLSNWLTGSPGSLTLTEIYDEDFNAVVDTGIGAAWARKATPGATGAGSASIGGGSNVFNGSILVALKAACVNNLITNGDFSNSGAGNNLAANWSVGSVGSYVETHPEDTYFTTGNTNGYTAELDSESSIKQTGITVVPNVSYTVSFIYAKRPTAPTPTGVTVRITGGSTFTSSGIETSVQTPSIGSFTFTPTSSSIGVEFYNSLNAGNTYGTIIDNIVLIPTSQVAPIATSSGGSLNTSTACAGTSVQLNVGNVPGSGVTYAWTGTGGAAFSSTTIQNPTVIFTNAGLQQATVTTTMSSGCSSSSTTYVNVNAIPTATAAGPSNVCQSASPTAIALTGASVGGGATTGAWSIISGGGALSSTAQTNSPATVTYTPAANYTGTVTLRLTSNAGTGCTAATSNRTINVNAISVAPTSITGTTTICNGTQTILTAAGGTLGTGANYQWGTGSVVGTSPLSGQTGSTLTITPGSSTTYWVRIENTTSPCGATTGGATQLVTVRTPSVAPTSITGTTTICNGTQIILTAAGGTLGTGANYQWGTGSVVGTSPLLGQTGSTLTITPGSSTTYWVRIENTTSPCGATTGGITQLVTVRTPSVAPTGITGTTTICNGTQTILTAAGGTLGTGANYQWGTGSVVGTSPLSGETGSTLTITPGTSTTYWVRIENTTSPCGTTTGGVTQLVTVRTPSVAPTSITGTTTICNGTQTILTAAGGTLGTGANYQWGTGSVVGTSPLSGETGSTLTITPGSSTTYWVRIENTTSPCGATTGGATQLVTVNQKSADPVSASAGSPTICNGVSTTLTLNGGGGGTGATVKWYTGSCGGTSVGTGNGLSVSPSVTTTYYGRYEDGTPCNNSACSSVTVTVNTVTAAPTITIKQPTCTVSTGVITVTSPAAGTGYNYSIDGSDYTNTTGIFTVAENTTYNVTTKNSSGCISPAEPAIILPSSDRVWNGSIDTDWTKAGNWTPNIVPGNTDCVVIPINTKKPEIAAGTSADAYSLTIDSQGLLTVNSKAILTVVTGITVASDGNLVFEDDSSLLQKTENAVNTGNITYKRITAKVSRYDFTFWSSPVTRTPLAYTLADVSPLTLADKYYSYIPAVGWKVSYRGELPMEPGMGYIIRAPQTYAVAKALAQTYEASFIGKPNNGTIEITPVKDESIMVGNPYPSALNAREFIEYNELVRNIQVGSLYFWTHNSPPSTSTPGDYKYNYTTSDYAVYNLTGSTTGASTLPNNDPPSGFIAAGAAFFMTPNSSDKIAFTNDMRVGTDNDQFFKTAKAKDEEKNRLWLNLINNQGAFKQLLVGYLDGATNNFDYNYDGETLDGNTYVDFYSINETDKLTIQGRALPFSDADLIPLGYVSSIVGDFTISIDHADGLFDTQAVYLEDKNTGKTVDLRAANYTFTTAKGTFEDRFVLKYADKTLGTGDFENIENGLLVSVKDKAVKITSAKESIKEVTIFDINGKLLYDKKKVGSTELQISNLQAANQVLLVKVMLENGFTTTKKIIFQ